MTGSKEMHYPQFDMGPPPEPFFSWAGGRKRSRIQIIGFLGLHAVTSHELSEGHGGRQMTSRLMPFKVSQRTKIPQPQKSPVLFRDCINPNLFKSWSREPIWSRPSGRKLLLTTLKKRSWRLLQTDWVFIKNKVSYSTEAEMKAFND